MEKRDFKMHTELLRSVIKDQAGTLQKAVLEGVMNSVDAGSTFVDVTITPELVKIIDDGRGFTGRKEIEEWFETFGTPHDEAEANKPTYGKFRMGRGQMFAFGKNVWRTGKFKMDVDIDQRLGYDLDSNLPDSPGCEIQITLYETLNQRSIYDIVKELTTMVKYVSIPVKVNEVVVSEPPVPSRFPHSTDDAFIRLSDEALGLKVYNLGVFVREYGRQYLGVGGVVVSKKQLAVNFARNDILARCPVWKAIKKVVDTTAVEKVKKKTSLSDDERANVIARLLAGELNGYDARSMKLFRDVRGKQWSAKSIQQARFARWSMARAGDHVGDKLIEIGSCLVLDQAWLEKFDCNPREVFTKFDLFNYRGGPKFVEMDDVRGSLNDQHIELPEGKWTPTERVWLELLERAVPDLFRAHAWNVVAGKRRQLRIGVSNTANGWTDGVSTIWIAREFLRGLKYQQYDAPYLPDLLEALLLLIHEYCHDEKERECMQHSPAFDERFREFSRQLPRMISGYLSMQKASLKQMMDRATEQCRKANRRDEERIKTPKTKGAKKTKTKTGAVVDGKIGGISVNRVKEMLQLFDAGETDKLKPGHVKWLQNSAEKIRTQIQELEKAA